MLDFSTLFNYNIKYYKVASMWLGCLNIRKFKSGETAQNLIKDTQTLASYCQTFISLEKLVLAAMVFKLKALL